MTDADMARCKARDLIRAGDNEKVDVKLAWSNYNNALTWLQRISTTYGEEWNVEDYELASYCQQMCSELMR